MRTVTFANEKVVDLINESYVALWHNHSPVPAAKAEEPQYTAAQVDAYPEGGGTGNLRTYVAAPDGTVVSEIRGFWRPARYLEELGFALDLSTDNARAKHAARAQALRSAASRLAAENPGQMGKRVKESAVRKEIAELLSIPLGTVKSRMSYGLDKLRPILKELYHAV
jgi:hypothetical protein